MIINLAFDGEQNLPSFCIAVFLSEWRFLFCLFVILLLLLFWGGHFLLCLDHDGNYFVHYVHCGV